METNIYNDNNKFKKKIAEGLDKYIFYIYIIYKNKLT